MSVKELWVYPVKALAGQSVHEAVLQQRGFENDRRWMLVDENGRFISQREHAHLARWQAAVEGEELVLRNLDTGVELRVPDAMSETGPIVPVEVWNDQFTAYQVNTISDEVLSNVLGLSCRLVYMGAGSSRPIDPRYARVGEEVSFADGYPYLIVSTGSLAALQKETNVELSIRRFRPNIVIDQPNAFAEDAWKEVIIGDQAFRLPKPCARCIVITIDPDTTDKEPRVFGALAGIHKVDRKVLFGMNACWQGTAAASIRVGDTLTVLDVP